MRISHINENSNSTRIALPSEHCYLIRIKQTFYYGLVQTNILLSPCIAHQQTCIDFRQIDKRLSVFRLFTFYLSYINLNKSVSYNVHIKITSPISILFHYIMFVVFHKEIVDSFKEIIIFRKDSIIFHKNFYKHSSTFLLKQELR